MVAHHREVIDGAWPVRGEEVSWERRRAQYVEWLASGEGTMLAALQAADPGGAPLGYAMLTSHPSGASFDLGERVGELESLAVAPGSRGTGVGTALLERARERFRAAGIEHWLVSVVEANEDAMRFYEREGFGPYNRYLLGRL